MAYSKLTVKKSIQWMAEFGVGKSRNYTVNMPQGAYNIANSSLKNSVYNDILGLQTYQNIIPNGKDILYSVNYSISSSEKIAFAGINGKRSMCLFENSVEPSLFIEFCRSVYFS